MEPGTEWVLLSAFLHNTSGEPVTLRRVWLEGEGISTVVEVFRVEAAPLPPLVDDRHFSPGGIFVTDPPATWLSGGCQTQTLFEVDGFIVPPDGELRVAVFLRALAPGHFDLASHAVEYEQGDELVVKGLPIGMRGDVTADGHPVPLERAQRRCLGAGRLLEGATAPSPAS